jgi:hypothetical protein
MIRLSELVPIPNPFPTKPKPPVSPPIIKSFRERTSQLVTLCLRTGVMNPAEAREFVKKANAVLGTVDDLQRRVSLREVLDNGDVYDLRTTWKEEYRKFLKFRDVLRDSLNVLVQNQFMKIEVGDKVKLEVDQFYEQLTEIDKTILVVLQRL